jgi:hypothetical protein
MSTAMHSVLSHDVARVMQRERQAEAAAHNRAARLVSARRWQRRAEVAAHRARLARLAVQ